MMKNLYRIEGDKVIIGLDRQDGGYLETMVSIEDFEHISSVCGKWYANYNARCNSLYVKVTKKIRGKTFVTQMHAWIMEQCKPDIKNIEIDHIDGDTLNNIRSNLRWVTKSENMQNREPRIGRDRDGKWMVKGLIGTYETRKEAIEARNRAELSGE